MRRPIAIALCCGLVLAFSAGCPSSPGHGGGHHGNAYRYVPAMPTATDVAVVDPYDGSIDLIDPVSYRRANVATTRDVIDAAVIDAGTALAVLDGKRDEARIVDVASRAVIQVIPVGSAINRLIASPFGPQALAIYDPAAGEADFGDGGVVDYYAVNVLTPQSGAALSVSIDFTPDNIVFSPDGRTALLGKEYRLLSLDLSTGETVAYPLSLGPEDPRVPREIVISPDGELAMVLVEGLPDVYVLDLVARAINILDLSDDASHVAFVPDSRLALLPLPGMSRVALVDLDAAIPEEIDLGTVAYEARIGPDGARALFYSENGSSVAVLTLADRKVETFPLSVRVSREVPEPVSFTPDGAKVLVFGEPGTGTHGRYDVNVIDLADRVVVPIGFEDRISRYAYGEHSVGVLMPLLPKLVRLELPDLQATAWDVPDMAMRMHYLSGAKAFLLDHQDKAGRLTFLPEDGDATRGVKGFLHR